MGQRKGPNKWDITLDGNKFKILKGQEQQGYQYALQHVSVAEQERFSPVARGHMQSRPDLRGFRQTNWSGGQTWFLPMLPPEDSDTYYYSSLFDSWSRPGNLLPMNQFTQSTVADIPVCGNFIRGEDGKFYQVSDDTQGGTKDIQYWNAAGDSMADENLASNISTGHDGAKLMYDDSDQTAIAIGIDSLDQTATMDVAKFDIEGATSSNILTSEGHAAGANVVWFDGKVMVYDGDQVRAINSGKTGYDATAVSDDGLGADASLVAVAARKTIGAWSAGTNVIHHGNMNLALGTAEGVYYVKHVYTGSGNIQARIFRVSVTEAGTYIREPIGNLPEGMYCLNLTWHLDSLLMIVTPDLGLLRENLTATGYFETQLWHYTQGTIGAVGTFEGGKNPSESPYTFPYSNGPVQYIGSDQKLWAYDAVRGGVHQVVEFASTIDSGIYYGFQADNSSGQVINIWTGYNTLLTQKAPHISDPNTGTWAAKSYTLESNYFNFGIDLEDKQLVSVTVLFEKGSANETYYVDVEADDSGSWTQVVALTCDNGDSPVTTDITASNITGNRFRYRIRLEIDSGTNMPEFRGIGFKALSGETVEIWDLTLDGTEIVNVENEKQDPNEVFSELQTSGRKEEFVTFTDHYGRSDTDANGPIDVRIDSIVAVKGDQHEGTWQVRLTRVSP